MIDYLKRFWAEAKAKVTTYVALLTAVLATLPAAVGDSWGQVSAIIPVAYQHAVLAALSLITIWTRVRRDLHP